MSVMATLSKSTLTRCGTFWRLERWLGADAPYQGHEVSQWQAYGWSVASVLACTLLNLLPFARGAQATWARIDEIRRIITP